MEQPFAIPVDVCPVVPKGTNGIVVLDLSASISTETYSRIGATLTDLVATRGRYGLVIFSDVAYEALPPGTPADALRPLIRYFKLPPQTQPGVPPNFPVNPWLQTFSGGKGDVSQDYTASLRWYQRARQLGEKIQVKGR